MAEDGKVVFRYIGDTSGIDSANSEAEQKVGGLGSRLGGIAAKTVAAIGAAASAAGVAVVKIGVEFESAFAGVIKTVDATDAELSALREGILDMSASLPASASEIAAVAEAAGQLGIETPNVLAFTRTMIDLGEATNLTADEAATNLARFANIMQMPQTEFDKLGSVIVSLGNNFATTEAEIVSMGMRLAGAGQQASMSEADIMSFATALSSVGIEADAGGTAFSKVITDINIAVQTGNDDLKKFAEVAGMSAKDFATAFQEDAAGAVTSFVTGLGSMDERGGSAILTLEDLGISEIRMRDALLRASGAGDLLTKALETGNAAWEENTALTKEAEQRYATIESKFGMLKNRLSTIAVDMYDSLREPLVGVMDEFGVALDEMRDSGTLVALGESLGQIATVLGESLIKMLPVLVELINTLLPPLMDVVETLLPPLLGLISSLMPIISESIDKLLPPLVELFSALAPPLLELIEALLPPLLEIFDALIDPLLDLIDVLLPPLVSLLELLGPTITALSPIIELLAELFSGYLGGAINQVMPIIETLMGVLEGLLEFITGAFSGDWEKAWDGVVKMFKGIINLLPAAVEGAINGAIGVINGLIKGVNKITGAIGIDAIPTIKKVSIPRFRVGLDYVPKDEFPALLHRGEAVLTAGDADLWRGLGGAPGIAAAITGPPLSTNNSSVVINQLEVYPDSTEYARILALLEKSDRARQDERAGVQ